MKAFLNRFIRAVTLERVLLLAIVVLQAAILGSLRKQPENRLAGVADDAAAGRPAVELQADAASRFAAAPAPLPVAAPSPAEMIGEMEAFLGTMIGDFEAIDRFMNPPLGWGAFEPTPALDMHESRDRYAIVFAVPHLDSASIRVSLDGRMLSVSGLSAGRHRHSAPRVLESRVLLPGPVGDAEDAEAVLTNGLLRVAIPKALPSRQVADSAPVVLRLR